jgi:hypothetical protein
MDRLDAGPVLTATLVHQGVLADLYIAAPVDAWDAGEPTGTTAAGLGYVLRAEGDGVGTAVADDGGLRYILVPSLPGDGSLPVATAVAVLELVPAPGGA